jgi:NADPH-dependent 2,4-dienoyl-CoA reductase/sulfur reductase-like enzyme
MQSIVVVGASLAGVHAAAALRRDGFGGSITMVDAQPHPPYDRPPLSKELLTGRFTPDDIGLRSAADLDVTWRLGTEVVGLELHGHGEGNAAGGRMLLASGDTNSDTNSDANGDINSDAADSIGFDGLVIACGAAARTLPGTADRDDVQVLRTLDDALALRAALDEGLSSIVVVGAGFIGLEVAASCRQRGVDVTIVEPMAAPLGRILGDDVGHALARVHRDHGVDVRLGVGVERIDGAEGGTGCQVFLDDGSSLTADRVVVGIGVVPNTAWLEGSGLTIDNGVVCDETLLAAPGVVAAGDLARWPSARFATMLRVEHWDHAVASGEAAARRLLAGSDAPAFDPVPWFWSDQYDTKVQLVGLAGADTEAEVVSGSLDEDRFAVVYGRNGWVTGVLGVNRPRHVALMRARVEQGISFDDAVAAARDL